MPCDSVHLIRQLQSLFLEANTVPGRLGQAPGLFLRGLAHRGHPTKRFFLLQRG